MPSRSEMHITLYRTIDYPYLHTQNELENIILCTLTASHTAAFVRLLNMDSITLKDVRTSIGITQHGTEGGSRLFESPCLKVR